MCLTGGKAKDPGTYEEWRMKDKTAGNDGSRVRYDDAVKRWQGSDEYKTQQEQKTIEQQQAEQEKEIEEAAKSEAQKTAEAKEKAMEEKIATVTAPVSTMEPEAPAKRRQEETKLSVEEPLPEAPAAKEMVADTPESSLIKKRKQEQRELISGLSKKRSRARGRRSLITGKSGGGIGYYSRFFT